MLSRSMLISTALPAALLLGAVGCSSEDSAAPGPSPSSDAGSHVDADAETQEPEADVPSPLTFQLTLLRENRPDLPGFTAELTIAHADGTPADPAEVTFTSSRGEAAGTVESGGGVYRQPFQPDAIGTGEYEVTAIADGEEVASATALVMKTVGTRWGQPRKVEGLVNTEGWEDTKTRPGGSMCCTMTRRCRRRSATSEA